MPSGARHDPAHDVPLSAAAETDVPTFDVDGPTGSRANVDGSSSPLSLIGRLPVASSAPGRSRRHRRRAAAQGSSAPGYSALASDDPMAACRSGATTAREVAGTASSRPVTFVTSAAYVVTTFRPYSTFCITFAVSFFPTILFFEPRGHFFFDVIQW